MYIHLILPSLLMLCALPAIAADDAPACKRNYKQEGSFIAGRRFSTWDVVPVAPSAAYKRIYAEVVKAGLTIVNSDKEMGVISIEQKNGGVTNTGAQVDLPWNVVIEASGKGSKVSVTKTTPGGYSTSQDFQIASMCGVIDAARQ